MLRKFLDYQLSITEQGKPLQRLRPLVEALDTFLYESPHVTRTGPHIRDAVDVKRWMIIVVIALLPAILVAIWNTGLQSLIYSSGNYRLMDEYLTAAQSLSGYMHFALKDQRYLSIWAEGLKIVLPIILISYVVGGLCEAIFAIVRKHEITEGFLVTGILYALVLPSTLPYWMTAVGVAVGIILSKEVFGGSGMNIVNPALACRAFLFFTFPGRMSGDIWAGSNPTVVRQSLLKMNEEAQRGSLDAYSQATPLSRYNITADVKKIHVDAIATNQVHVDVPTQSTIEQQFHQWASGHEGATLGQLSTDQMQQFITAPLPQGGLGLPVSNFEDAYHFSALQYDFGTHGNWNYFFGDRLGCIGGTSVFASLLGAIILIWTGVGSWRSMGGMFLGAYLTALLFNVGAHFVGNDGGAWNPATFGFPAYKHLLLGGLSFGAVFMITDPVSSPGLPLSRWIYGFFAGFITILIRTINPAYPEGVMLAILLANVFAPLIDYYVIRFKRRRARRGILV